MHNCGFVWTDALPSVCKSCFLCSQHTNKRRVGVCVWIKDVRLHSPHLLFLPVSWWAGLMLLSVSMAFWKQMGVPLSDAHTHSYSYTLFLNPLYYLNILIEHLYKWYKPKFWPARSELLSSTSNKIYHKCYNDNSPKHKQQLKNPDLTSDILKKHYNISGFEIAMSFGGVWRSCDSCFSWQALATVIL